MEYSGKLIKQITEAMEKKSNNLLREYDITIAQLRVLHDLLESPGHTLSFKDVEKLSGISQSACVGIVSRLAEKKLVKTAMNKSDRREKKVHLTAAGEKLCQLATATVDLVDETLFKDFSEEEIAQLQALLERLYVNIGHSL